jgi:hypothetical protein
MLFLQKEIKKKSSTMFTLDSFALLKECDISLFYDSLRVNTLYRQLKLFVLFDENSKM